MKCPKCGLTMKPGQETHELAECFGALRYSHVALTDACRRLLEAASDKGGHVTGDEWRAFHQDVLSVGSQLSLPELRDEIDRVLAKD